MCSTYFVDYLCCEKYLALLYESISSGPASRSLIGDYNNVCMRIFIYIFLEANYTQVGI